VERKFSGHDPYNFIPFLAESLRRDHVSFWTDNDLHAGDEYQKLINEKIDSSQFAILIVSQHFLNSPAWSYCRQYLRRRWRSLR
jgi:hypothetical protein